MKDNIFIAVVSCILLAIFVFCIVLCSGSIERYHIEDMEKQIKLCIANGGKPNTYIRKNYNDSIPVVECEWE